MDDALDPLAERLAEALHPAYLLVRKLGEGGMGAVYLARDPGLKRDVAVKVLRPDLARDPVARTRFEREAEAVAAISHPNVINIYTVGQMPEGTPYFVMQFATGRSLELRLEKDGPLPMPEARRILGEVASALAAAHKRGIVHRDIKPANVLQDEASGRVIVTDFGIAAVQQADPQAVKLTDTGMSPGTPYYMSPEQLLNEPVSDRTDVYSLGILGYELLTGAGPFRATSPHEVAAAHLRDTPAPLSNLRADVPAEFEHLIAACLAKAPAERPAAEAIVQRLVPGSGTLLEWPPPGLELLAGRWAAVNRRLGLGSGLLMAGTLGMILADPSSGPPVPNVILTAVAAFGALVMASAILGAFGLMGDARRAVRRGYAWSVVAEAAADVRGDTGALMTGSRDYAMHDVAVRRRVRAWRVARAVLASVAAALPVPSLLLAVRSGLSGSAGPVLLAAVVLVPALLVLEGALLLRFLENRVVHRAHTRRRRARSSTLAATNIVSAWNASFQEARAGTLVAHAAPFLVGRAAGAAMLIVVAAGAILAMPLVGMNTIMDVLSAVAVPRFGSTRARVYPALAGAPWAPPTDSSISARAAGEALQTLATAGTAPGPGYLEPPIRLRQPFLPISDTNPFHAYPGQIQDSLLRLGVRRAFTPAQLAYLRSIAANPGWAAVRTLARAGRADVVTTRFPADILASADWYELWIPRSAAVKEAGFAAAAVAALRLAEGRRDEAEAALRDAVGLGLALMRDGIYMIDTWQGASITNNALDRLVTLYELTGRPDEARRLREARDEARARADQRSEVEDAALSLSGGSQRAEVRKLFLRLVADSTMPASFRWNFIHNTAIEQCIDAHELVFGTRPDLVAAVRTFERQVVRTRGDSLLLAVVRQPRRSARRSGLATLLYGRSHTGVCLQILAAMF